MSASSAIGVFVVAAGRGGQLGQRVELGEPVVDQEALEKFLTLLVAS